MALSTAVNVPNTQDQIVTIGVEMTRKTQYFETGLSKWSERPEVKYTWNIYNPTYQQPKLP